jgi:hypothetical protein
MKQLITNTKREEEIKRARERRAGDKPHKQISLHSAIKKTSSQISQLVCVTLHFSAARESSLFLSAHTKKRATHRGKNGFYEPNRTEREKVQCRKELQRKRSEF